MLLESTGNIMEVIGYDYISHIYFPYIFPIYISHIYIYIYRYIDIWIYIYIYLYIYRYFQHVQVSPLIPINNMSPQVKENFRTQVNEATEYHVRPYSPGIFKYSVKIRLYIGGTMLINVVYRWYNPFPNGWFIVLPPEKMPPSGSRGERVPAQAEAEAESQVPQETAVPWRSWVPWVGISGEIWGRI